MWGQFSAVGKWNSPLFKSVVKSEAKYALIIIGMCLNVALLNWVCCIYFKMKKSGTFLSLESSKVKKKMFYFDSY